MHRRTLFALAPLAALALTAATPATQPGDERLVPRLRAHFDGALAELRAADVSHLSADQLARRKTLIDRLQRYRDRAVFPHNYDFPGQAVPYFVDRRTGTLCAVAHLLESTGRRDIVNRVAAMDNNVWVRELAGDAEFGQWLSEQGITLAEAARIQAPYVIDEPDMAPLSTRSSALPALAGVGAVGITAVNLFTNGDGHGRIRNWLGVGAGVANMALGAATLSSGSQPGVSGFTQIGLGALSTAISSRAMFRRHSALAARRDAERGKVAIAPIVPTSESGAGLSLNVRF